MFWVRSILNIHLHPLTITPDRNLHLPGSLGSHVACLHCETQHPVRALIFSTYSEQTLTSSLRRFIPIVILALVFNVSNAVGFTYAYVSLLPSSPSKNMQCSKRLFHRDRDAKARWADAAAGGFGFGLGGFGGQIIASAVKSRVNKIFG